MDYKQYYSIKNASYTDRESFNNTILLLTMVKSDYYYIVGFSREENKITIAFDFRNDYNCILTEYVDIDFSAGGYIVLSSKLESINSHDKKADISFAPNHHFKVDEGIVSYVSKIEKDAVFPIGIQKMNEYILSVKYEISSFVNQYLNHL